MRIDSHQHFWKFDKIRDSWITDEMSVLQRDFLPDELRSILIENKFDGCVAVQADQSEQETDFLLSLVSRFDFIKGVVGWVDLKADNLSARLEYYKQFSALKGFRHIVQGEPKGFLADQKFIKGVRTLSEFGFTYDLLIYHHQMGEAIEFLKSVENVTIVLDHSGKPSIRTGEKDSWQSNLKKISAFPNVHCKVSGLVTEADWKSWNTDQIVPFLDCVMDTFGPSRMMYGSDWPVCLLGGNYEAQLKITQEYISGLSKSEQEGIMGENAFRNYNL